MQLLKKLDALDYIVLAGLAVLFGVIIAAISVDAYADEQRDMLQNICPPAVEVV